MHNAALTHLALLTTNRADYGIARPLIKAIHQSTEHRLMLWVGSSHYSQQHGRSATDIEQDGFPITSVIETLPTSDSPQTIAAAMARTAESTAIALQQHNPDLLILIGDRYETASAALTAVPFRTPMLHIHGGEITQGAIDDVLRHSITKCSHLHAATTPTHANRIIQMGESPWRVKVTGAPGLDNLNDFSPIPPETLLPALGLEYPSAYPPLLFTYHPVTLEHDQAENQIRQITDAMMHFPHPIIITSPNTDTGANAIQEHLQKWVAATPNAHWHPNLGTDQYFSIMSQAAAMIGNSSSGIIEAASFKLPVVNIGNRQKGREAGRNVIHTPCESTSIVNAIRQAVSPAFRASIDTLINPYGDGQAASRIMTMIKEAPVGKKLLEKDFYEMRGQILKKKP